MQYLVQSLIYIEESCKGIGFIHTHIIIDRGLQLNFQNGIILDHYGILALTDEGS